MSSSSSVPGVRGGIQMNVNMHIKPGSRGGTPPVIHNHNEEAPQASRQLSNRGSPASSSRKRPPNPTAHSVGNSSNSSRASSVFSRNSGSASSRTSPMPSRTPSRASSSASSGIDSELLGEFALNYGREDVAVLGLSDKDRKKIEQLQNGQVPFKKHAGRPARSSSSYSSGGSRGWTARSPSLSDDTASNSSSGSNGIGHPFFLFGKPGGLSDTSSASSAASSSNSVGSCDKGSIDETLVDRREIDPRGRKIIHTQEQQLRLLDYDGKNTGGIHYRKYKAPRRSPSMVSLDSNGNRLDPVSEPSSSSSVSVHAWPSGTVEARKRHSRVTPLDSALRYRPGDRPGNLLTNLALEVTRGLKRGEVEQRTRKLRRHRRPSDSHMLPI